MQVEEMNPVMQNSFKRALVHAKLSVVSVFFWTVQHVQSPISSSISKGQKVSCTYSKLEEGFISSYFLSVFFFTFLRRIRIRRFQLLLASNKLYLAFQSRFVFRCYSSGPKVGLIACQLRQSTVVILSPVPRSQEPINRLLSLYNVKDES